MATQCTDNLNLLAFTSPSTWNGVLYGIYGFMDYAVVNWTRHFQAAVVETDAHDELLRLLAEYMSVFLELHWNSPGTTFTVSKRVSDRLQFFRDYSFYNKLEQAVVSANKQLKLFGNVKEKDLALNIVNVVGDVRSILEHIISSLLEPSVEESIRERYGTC